MARITMAALMAEIEALKAAAAASSPVAPSEASAHWKAADITCNGHKGCVKTFRTIKGRDWHVANGKAVKA